MRLFKRKDVWWVDFRAEGFGRHSTGKTDKTQATIQAATILVQLQAAASKEPDRTHTVGALFQAWSKDKPAGDVQRCNAFVDWYGSCGFLSDLTTKGVTRWMRALLEERSGTTVARYRATLAAFCKWAAQEGFITASPVPGSWCPKTPSLKKHGLSIEEVRETLDKAKALPPLFRAYHLAFFAGMRRGEIARARWEDVDFEKKTLMVRGTKTAGSKAVIPLHPELEAHLRGRLVKEGPLVPNQLGGHYHAQSLDKMRRSIPGLPGFHRGRHTLATVLVESGVDIYHVSELLRHKSVHTTQQYYAHRSPSKRMAELENFRIGQ